MPIGKHYDLDIDGTLANNSDNTIASQKAIKTYVDNKPKEIPSQTGNSGKFLTTNGTYASWSESMTWTYNSSTENLTID